MVDTSESPGLGYMEIVAAHYAATLLPIIRAHTAPELASDVLSESTTIHSDQWQAYTSMNTLPGVAAHGVVNHSLHFIDPSSGIRWKDTGTRLKQNSNK